MHHYDHTSPTKTEHTLVEHGEEMGGVHPMDNSKTRKKLVFQVIVITLT